MRLIKLALISVVVLFLVIWGLSLLIPSEVRISRAINIAAPPDSVLHRLTNLEQWPSWNELLLHQTRVSATPTSYQSDQLTIRLISRDSGRLQTTWQQQQGRELASGITWQTEGDVTVVQWYFDFKLNWYPWEKFGSIVFDKQLGPPMEKSLGNLKKLMEKQP